MVLCLTTFILTSEAAIDNTNASSPNQSGNPTTTYMDYFPLVFLLIFSMAVLYLEYYIASKISYKYQMHTDSKYNPFEWSAHDQIRFVGLTIVVILAVFVIIIPNKSIDSNLTAALFGFLGTVVGYLAGSSRASGDDASGSNQKPPGKD